MEKPFKRREFLKTTALAGAGLSLAPGMRSAPRAGKNPSSKVRLAILGCGLRGQSHLELALRRDDCEVTAVNEIEPVMLERTRALFEKHGHPQPTYYTDGEEAFRALLAREDLDAVLIASPWRWHTPMATAALEAGRYVGMEVCGGFSLEECWQLVRTHERTGTHLFFLENVCYRRDVLAVLNMVRQGLFGELIHLECGYQHDLRAVKFNDGKQPYGGGVEFGEKGFSEAKWRTIHSVHRNGDLYPTHGIGPVAQFIDINRGNRFLSLCSMASKARGLHDYILNHPKGGPQHPNAQIEFKLGDKVTTLIQCAHGETVVVHHDTNLPRPYSLGFRVQGTRGLWMDVNDSLYLEGTSPTHRWEPAQPYLQRYDHPLWQRLAERATGAGHGGMDFFLFNAFVESVKRAAPPPLDVYDAATWLAITPLSEQSIAAGGQPQPFPDFTNGRWMFRQPNFALDDTY